MVYPLLRYTSAIWLLLSLLSCTYNPLSQNNHLTGGAEGTALGGAVGLGAAAALGASDTGLAFATLGGASIGYYLTTLRFAAAGIYQAGGQVYTQGDYVTIELPSNQLFDVNSADLLPEAEPALKSTANVLRRYCCESVLVSGNTSGFASNKYERRLSKARAKAVSAFLWSQGISSNGNRSRHLNYVGYGNYFPIASDMTNHGIRENSRIQITVYPSRDRMVVNQKQMVFNNVASIKNDAPATAPINPKPAIVTAKTEEPKTSFNPFTFAKSKKKPIEEKPLPNDAKLSDESISVDDAIKEQTDSYRMAELSFQRIEREKIEQS